MKKLSNYRSGFSLIEMLIATVLVMFLSATSYKILTGQGNRQRESVYSQKQNTQVLAALDRFKKEASLIDYNWIKYGVASVYPHQGYGMHDNFYVNPFTQSEGLSDGVTFLKRNVQKSNLITLDVNAEYPTATAAGNVDLYNAWLNTVEVPDVAVNDWVIVYSAGKYALGVVSETSTGKKFKMRAPDPFNNEVEQTHYNSLVNRSSGYVTLAGVVPGSFDWTSTNTASPDDDTIKFDKTKTYVQVVEPVTYELDWATTDKLPAGGGNQHILDADGNPKKVIVRTAYTPGPVREYLAESNQLGFTYDALVSRTTTGGTTVDSLDGFTSGEIVKDVGRETNTTVQFVNLSVSPNNPGMSSDAFVSTSKIISLRMFAADDHKSGESKNQKYNEVRVALDPSRINDQYQDASSALAQNSDDLVPAYGQNGERIGQPLYLRHVQRFAGRPAPGARMNQVYVPGTGKVDIVIPIGGFDTDPKNPKIASGKLVVLDEEGKSATRNTGCSSTNCEQITFTPKEANQVFLPSTMIEKETDENGMNSILVGGFSVQTDSKGKMTRKPMMAQIKYPGNMQFRDYVAANNNTGGSSTCSLTGCELIAINEMTIVGASDRLRDTAAGISVDGDDVYMASITKGNSADDTLSVYKTDTNFTTFKEQIVDSTQGIAKGRVISSISQTPIEVNGIKYLPIGISRTISDGATPTEDGKILLYNLSNPAAEPIEIANHNFKVNSMTAMNGNLVFSGKLVTQIMNSADIAAIVQGTTTTVPTFYTDELANYIPASGGNPAVKEYADGYFTLSSAYSNRSPNDYQQVLGWNTGMNASKIKDMEFGFVLGNQSYMHTENPKPTDYQQQDFTTLSVNFGGMSERVIASIDTNFSNLEASQVVTKYDQQASKVPNVLLPGVMYASTKPRVDAAPLPKLVNSMDENAWVAFYQDYVDIKDQANGGAVQPLPDPNAAIFSCGNSVPPTCSAGP